MLILYSGFIGLGLIIFLLYASFALPYYQFKTYLYFKYFGQEDLNGIANVGPVGPVGVQENVPVENVDNNPQVGLVSSSGDFNQEGITPEWGYFKQ